MMVFKRKQIVVLSLVLMIVIAGYLQYTFKKDGSASVAGNENSKLGEAVYVDNQDASVANSATTSGSTSKDTKDNKSSSIASASIQANNYFAQARIDKESTRGKNTESLKAIADDTKVSKEIKSKAQDQMLTLISYAEKETNIETLIKAKGYSDAVATFGDDGSLDIVVKAPTLTEVDTAQIADIAARQGNVKMTEIYISNKY